MRPAAVQARPPHEWRAMAGTLKKVLYFLGILDDTDVEWMVRNGHRRIVPVGKTIIREGEPTEALFFVLAGEFAVTSKKVKAEIARIQSGEVVGEISFVDSRPASATVTAVAESVVGAVPIEALERRLEQEHSFKARFFKSIAVTLAGRLRVTNTLGHKAAPGVNFDDDDDNEIAPEVMDQLAMAGARFADMQRRSWGA
jgi:CRP/FNR family cyclic AMP-dependent transcriptional regulator